MEHHLGRLIDHVHIVVSDLEKSRCFYRALLESIGRTLNNNGVDSFGSDELYISQVDKTHKLSRIHLAFQAASQEMVKRFHEAGIAAGGTDNGAPGERSYHPGYYAAFILDPDGNNLEAVYHGPGDRSVDSVVIIPK